MSHPINKKRPRRVIHISDEEESVDRDGFSSSSSSSSSSSDGSGLDIVDLTSDACAKDDHKTEDKNANGKMKGGASNEGRGHAGAKPLHRGGNGSSSNTNASMNRQAEKSVVAPARWNNGSNKRSFAGGLQIPPFRPKAVGTEAAAPMKADSVAGTSAAAPMEVGSDEEDSDRSSSCSSSSSSDDGSGSGSDEDSGFIPFLKPSADKPDPYGPYVSKAKPSARPLRSNLKANSASGTQKSQGAASFQRTASPVDRLWPSPSRFYIALLRWNFCPARLTIEEDAPSSARMKELAPVPTEFIDVVEYRTLFSRLVMKEAISNLQKDLMGKGMQGAAAAVTGKVISASLVDDKCSSSTSSTSKTGKLYSFQVQIDVPPNAFRQDQEPPPPFPGGEVVGISSPFWPNPSSAAVLGVVQSWDPVYDKVSKKKSAKGKVFMRFLVCAHSGGGDGVGGLGGWIPLAHVQSCVGLGAGGGAAKQGIPVSLMGVGSVMTASREFQAVMSMSAIPESVQRHLLRPSVAKEGSGARPSSSASASGKTSHSAVGRKRPATEVGGSAGGDRGRDAEIEVPPPNVPAKLWNVLTSSFNRSQMLAIRKVAEGSPSGFTLLQGPPGTGKTRTIMGIVGVLLGGGCPHPTWHSGESATASSIVIGSSLSGNISGSRISKKKQKMGKRPGQNVGARIPDPTGPGSKRVRVLVVAPSNAACDELVLRLCQVGVPGADGRRFFPKVARVGGPRFQNEDGERGGFDRRDRGRGGGRDAISPDVEAMSLDRLAELRKRTHGGGLQSNRLSILLEADVVCATLSGSGSQALVEAVLSSAEASGASGKNQKGKKKGKKKPLEPLEFDAVVMDEAAQAVEPSSLVPLSLNPRAVVLVGDPAQLPATIFSKEATNANYGQSLFQRLQRGGHPKMMLDTQYRMHPSIASFASSRFYHGQLKSAPTVTEASHSQCFHRLPRFAPYLFHNVPAGRLRRGGDYHGTSSTSLSNMEEVNYITSMLSDLVKSFPETNFNGRVGVIAPYQNQIQALRRSMWNSGLRSDGVEISTVDGFQGREKDIMILSCVRAPEEGSDVSADGFENLRSAGVGFLDDWRRLNVAITRAKHAMWIVGHAGVLKQSDEWRELINDSKKRDAFIDRSNSHSATSAAAAASSSKSQAGTRGTRWGSGDVDTSYTTSGVPSSRYSGAGPADSRWGTGSGGGPNSEGFQAERGDLGAKLGEPPRAPYPHPPQSGYSNQSRFRGAPLGAHYGGAGPLGEESLFHGLPIATPSRHGLSDAQSRPPFQEPVMPDYRERERAPSRHGFADPHPQS